MKFLNNGGLFLLVSMGGLFAMHKKPDLTVVVDMTSVQEEGIFSPDAPPSPLGLFSPLPEAPEDSFCRVLCVALKQAVRPPLPVGEPGISDIPVDGHVIDVGQIAGYYDVATGCLDLSQKNIIAIEGRVFSQMAAESVSGHRFECLRKLVLGGNPLRVLPEEIGLLNNLGALTLAYTNLETLPDAIGSLVHLQKLDLSHMPLVVLPHTIGRLSDLLWLNLSYTHLKQLPDEVRWLVNLQRLNLDATEFDTYPRVIMHLRGLQSLFLYDALWARHPEWQDFERQLLSTLHDLSIWGGR